MSVLVLNATYEPLRVVGLARAVVLVLQEKAEIVEAGEGRLRSPSTSIPVPSVIRLLRFVKVPFRTRIPLSRKALAARDGGRCQYCGKSGETIDHVLPRSRGGKHRWENVVLACRRCNAGKADKLLSELGWKLERTPVAPKATTWVAIGFRSEEAWQQYLGEVAPAV